MKPIVLLLGFCLAAVTLKAQFSDDFSDGDFTANPTWTGNDTNFEVNASQELWLNATPSTDEAALSTPSQAIHNAQWDFYVRLDFDPSPSNRARIYLVSDQSDLIGALNGYYVQIGGASGSVDDVSLYEQSGTSRSIIIDGVDGTAASDPEMRVRVTRDANANWELFIDTTATGTQYVSQGTVQDNAYTVSAFTGVFCDFTSSRSDLFFFDDFNVTGAAVPDLIPPSIDSVVVVSPTLLDVYFSETVALASAQTTGNYSIDNGIGSPASAVRDGTNTDRVRLTLGTSIQSNVLYTLTVTGVTDNSGNAMPATPVPFADLVPQPIDPRDVIIQEIFPDPTPPIGLPEAEYVEIYNRSSKTFNLQGWGFTDASSTIGVLPFYLLVPDGIAVLCAQSDSALLAAQGIGPLIILSAWPALNNSGDDLALLDDQGTVVDQVSYTTSWYRDVQKDDGGWSLELINPFASCSGAQNWRASDDLSGGTPGDSNSVFDDTPDTQAPSALQAQAIGNSEISVLFDEPMDSLSLVNATYTFSGGLAVQTIIPEGPVFERIRLLVNPSLTVGTIYDLTIDNAADCEGNVLNNAQLQVAIGAAPQPFEIVFNELYPDPDAAVNGLPESEFIELFNNTDRVLSVSGLVFSDATSSATLPDEVLFPNEYVIVCEDAVAPDWQPYGRVLELTSWPSLNNAGDDLTLSDANQVVIDEVRYTNDWYQDANKASGGWTLERIDPGNPCAGSSNWRASDDNRGGTPAEENSVFDDNRGSSDPAVVAVQPVDSQVVEVSFDRTMDATSLVGGTYTFTPSLSIDSVVPGTDLSTARIYVSSSVSSTVVYGVEVTNVVDCQGFPLGSDNRGEFKIPAFNDLVINEVLFDPRGSGSDFVELFNRLEIPVNLRNWAFISIASDGDVSVFPLTEQDYVLAPQEYVLLTEDAANIALEYPLSRTEVFVETNLPSYPNAAGTVTLISPVESVVDAFAYTDDLHFGLLRDTEGVSLERLDVNRATNESTNWHSAAESVGFATPGYANSQESSAVADNNEITIEPKTFSPDNDGQDDVVNIAYRYDRPGYVANVRIYDSNGREVRDLVTNGLMGLEGAYSWDGMNNDNEKAAIGIYVIYIEVFTLDGDVEHYKETCVLATRF